MNSEQSFREIVDEAIGMLPVEHRQQLPQSTCWSSQQDWVSVSIHLDKVTFIEAVRSQDKGKSLNSILAYFVSEGFKRIVEHNTAFQALNPSTSMSFVRGYNVPTPLINVEDCEIEGS